MYDTVERGHTVETHGKEAVAGAISSDSCDPGRVGGLAR